MFCPKCGKEIKDSSKYCKYCGVSLNTHPQVSKIDNSNSDKNKNIIIITLAIIILIIVGCGIFLMYNHNNSNDSSINNNANKLPLNILSGSFSTGSAENDLTYGKLYVGSQHAGENVYVSTVWSRDGSNLNNGNRVLVTVDSSGYINYNSGVGFHYYPDKAVVNLYFANGTLSETKIVNLSPTSGTQTF